jgi:hypothetical protein
MKKLFGIRNININGLVVYVVCLRLRSCWEITNALATAGIPFKKTGNGQYIMIEHVTTDVGEHSSLVTVLGPILKQHAINQVANNHFWQGDPLVSFDNEIGACFNS